MGAVGQKGGLVHSVRVNHMHEAMYSLELPRRLIRLFSDPGEIVLDAFLGSGTTALAAAQLGRRFIGIEREARYCRLAADRIEAQLQIRPPIII